MANLIGIVGAPGTGKSTSLRNLDPKTTYIINTLNKPLPFKGSAASYNVDKKNLAPISEWDRIVGLLRAVSEKRQEIKTIIIDDASFIMSIEFFKRARETGYNKFSEIGQHMFEITNAAKELRDDLNVVFMFHEDLQLVDGFMPVRKIKTVGKMLDDKFTPEALFTVLLYTDVESTKDGNKYSFITNRSGDIPAKSPMGMFKDSKVDNDLNEVLKIINEYYG